MGHPLVKKAVIYGFACLVAAAAATWVIDYAVLCYRVARNRSPYGTVTVQSYYAVPQKTGKTEFDFQSEQQETCTNSLFPHMGYLPCWYARRHTDQPIRL